MSARLVARIAGLGAVLALGAGCGSSGGSSVAPAADTGTPTVAATHTVTSQPSTSPLASQTKLSARQLADPGIASQLGSKLTAAQAKRLVQYLEDRVNHAYSTGDANALTHYLAGPMLSGNRATILLLNKEHRHNVVAVTVKALKIQTETPGTAIVDMRGRLTTDYFVETRTHKVLANGLPGAKPVHFLVFLNQNPSTHTWYWTGEQAVTNSNSAATSTGAG